MWKVAAWILSRLVLLPDLSPVDRLEICIQFAVKVCEWRFTRKIVHPVGDVGVRDTAAVFLNVIVPQSEAINAGVLGTHAYHQG